MHRYYLVFSLFSEDSPWYTHALGDEKRKRRRLERKKQSSGLLIDHEAYIEQRNKYNIMCDQVRIYYHRSKIFVSDSKEKWAFCNKLFGNSQVSVLPSGKTDTKNANDFNSFFFQKIETIRDNLKSNPLPCPLHIANARSIFQGEPMSEFRPVPEDEVRKVVSDSPGSSAFSDPIPTRVLKRCLSSFITVLTLIVNLSLPTGEFCSNFKTAFVTPLLKKFDLDPSIFKNFRPVSNLSFVSKLIERLVSIQLQEHLICNKILDKFQSDYRCKVKVDFTSSAMQSLGGGFPRLSRES